MLRRLTALAALALALAVPALERPVAAAAASGDAAIARAAALADRWGRCPTARPAHRALARARRTAAPRPRARRARVALRSWRSVARECSRPVDQPTVSPVATP
jgi:hypothetical protein